LQRLDEGFDLNELALRQNVSRTSPVCCYDIFQRNQEYEKYFDLILLLVWCHVVAVGFYLLVKGDNLIWPMVTGKKHRSYLPAELNIVFTRLYIAMLLLAVSAGVAAWIMIQGESIL